MILDKIRIYGIGLGLGSHIGSRELGFGEEVVEVVEVVVHPESK